jgi:hypothetical protein
METTYTEPEPLKRAVVKEELVAITGDCITAMILNQFIYWSERRKDADKFLQEEIEIAQKYGNEETDNSTLPKLSYGWIYKKTEELADELMLSSSRQTVRKHITSLVKAGFIDERRNPKYKWDQTVQYRVNLYKIQTELEKYGYTLEGYTWSVTVRNNSESKIDVETEANDNNVSSCNCSVSKTDIGALKNLRTIPEITSETTVKTVSKIKPAKAGEHKLENVGKGMNYKRNTWKSKMSADDIPYPGSSFPYPGSSYHAVADDELM